MEKNTKMLLGVAVLGVAGYLYWQSTQSSSSDKKNYRGEDSGGECAWLSLPNTPDNICQRGHTAKCSVGGDDFYKCCSGDRKGTSSKGGNCGGAATQEFA